MFHKYIIDLNDFEIIKAIGSGGFGIVYLVERKDTHKIFSAKVYKFNIETIQDQQSFFQELEALSKAKHPSILSFHGFNLKNFEKENFPTIITEYMSNGSLDHALKKPSYLTMSNKYIILYGIAEGMKYLHSQGIIHRDLKPGNILLNDNLYPYIGDFGLSKISDLSVSSILFDSVVGTPIYMAPEIFLEEKFTYKVDVYSFSIIAYQLLTGKEPFPEIKTIFKLQKEVTSGKRPDLKCINDEYIRSLLNKWWSMKPDDRPSFHTIIEEIKDGRFKRAIGVENNHEVEKYLNIFTNRLPPLHREFNHIQETKKEKPNFNPNCEKRELEEHSLNLKPKTFPTRTNQNLNCPRADLNSPKPESLSLRQKPKICSPKSDLNSSKPASNSPRPKPNIKSPKTDLNSPNSNSSSPRPDSLSPRSKPNINSPKPDLNSPNSNSCSPRPDSLSPRSKPNINSLNSNSCSPRPDSLSPSTKPSISSPKSDSSLPRPMNAEKSPINDKNLSEEERKIYELKMLADRGDVYAMLAYATMCYERKDKDAAIYIKKAADTGDNSCMHLYALMKLHGEQTSIDKREAAQYFKKAADNGYLESMKEYGKMLYNGDGVPFNAEEAVHYLKMAIEKGCEASMYYYAIMLYFGKGIPIDKKKAAEYFKMSADKGVENSMYNYAVICRDGEGVPVNKKEAAEYFKKSADKGYVKGMFNYANMCWKGNGIPVNNQEAEFYYQKAIDEGDLNSMYNYASMLSNGEKLIIENQKALNLYKTAADKGHADSMYTYGVHLCIKSLCQNINKDHYDENFELGIKYLKEAANKGDTRIIEKYANFAFDFLSREEIEELLCYVKNRSDEGNERFKELYTSLESKRPNGNGKMWRFRIYVPTAQ